MRRRLDSLLAAPGLTHRRFVALAVLSLLATTVVVAEGFRPDGAPYGLLAAAYSRPAPTVEVAAPPAPVPAASASARGSVSSAGASAADTSAPASDLPVADSTPVDTTPTTPTPTPTQATPTPVATPPVQPKPASRIKHVFVVDIAGSDPATTWGDGSPATYLNGTLKPQGVFLGGYRQLPEGELASLIALTSGQAPTPQMQSGCPQYGDGCVFPVETLSLPDQLLAKALRWRAYIEGAGRACRPPAADSGDDYTTRHNPFVYYRSLTELGECTANDLPLDGLAGDLKTEADTPNFAFIQPNLCHGGWEDPCVDGSPGGPSAADAFLANISPQILDSPAYKADGLLIVLTPTGALFVSPLLPSGAADQTEVDPYSVLRYIEDLFGLDYLAKAKGAVPLTLAIPRA